MKRVVAAILTILYVTFAITSAYAVRPTVSGLCEESHINAVNKESVSHSCEAESGSPHLENTKKVHIPNHVVPVSKVKITNLSITLLNKRSSVLSSNREFKSEQASTVSTVSSKSPLYIRNRILLI